MMVTIIWTSFVAHSDNNHCDICGRLIDLGTTITHKETKKELWVCDECLEKIL